MIRIIRYHIKKGREEEKRQVKEAKYRHHHLGIKRNSRQSSSGHIFSDRCRLSLGMAKNYGEVNASLTETGCGRRGGRKCDVHSK